MPHECTNCGRTFPDGSKEMLSGCPDCGGNKFKFEPSSGPDTTETGTERSVTDSTERTDPDRTASTDADQTTSTAPDRTASADSGADTDDPFESHEWPDTASTTPPDAHDKTGRAGEPTLDDDGRRRRETQETGEARETQETRETRKTQETGERQETRETQGSRGSHERREQRETRETPETTRTDTTDTTDTTPEESNTLPDRPGSVTGDRPHADVETDAAAADRTDGIDQGEDAAQADARSAMVSGDELPDYDDDGSGSEPERAPDTGPDTTPASGVTPDTGGDAGADSTPEASRSDDTGDPPVDPEFERMREELNDQFESIRIVRPGEYELNLVELYDREEFIISLREDGRYVIEMPEAWDSPGD